MIRATEQRRINPTGPVHGALLRSTTTPISSRRGEFGHRHVIAAA